MRCYHVEPHLPGHRIDGTIQALTPAPFFYIQTCLEASVFCLSKVKCPTTFRSSKRSMFSTKHGNGNYSSDSRHFAGCLSHFHCLPRSKLACTSDNGSLSGQGAGWVVGDKVDSASEHMQIELQMNFAGEKHRQIGSMLMGAQAWTYRMEGYRGCPHYRTQVACGIVGTAWDSLLL
ncbi:hypothetical protein BJ165DRAFT_853408 [Panaeolus papilionaceus]|nr:hypothetical protein BJ165DRAFT_853408 [Panaeolus papilionaceus]